MITISGRLSKGISRRECRGRRRARLIEDRFDCGLASRIDRPPGATAVYICERNLYPEGPWRLYCATVGRALFSLLRLFGEPVGNFVLITTLPCYMGDRIHSTIYVSGDRIIRSDGVLWLDAIQSFERELRSLHQDM